MKPIRTERLILRNWRDDDRPLFHRINSDERVMEFFPFRRSRAEADVKLDAFRVEIEQHGFGWTPAEVAQRLTERSMQVSAEEVVNSPQAAAALLAAVHHDGDAVLVVGTEALDEAVAAVGLRPVRSADDDPVAVVQGYSPDTGWRDLAEACLAIRAGADWVATNADSTLPTDRGILPGNGAMVAALVAATGSQPRVAGKPERPLLDAAVARVSARRPLVVGDRLNTDIAAAAHAGMDSLMVLTGVSTSADLLDTDPSLRPTYVAADLRGLTGGAPLVRLADIADDAALRSALDALRDD